MSKNVINSVSPKYDKIFGHETSKVIGIDTSTATVSDQSDLDALEAKLNRRIDSLQQSFEKLDAYLQKIAAVTENMPNEIKAEVQKLAEQQKVVLNNEYKKIVDDMAKKCADVSAILKN